MSIIRWLGLDQSKHSTASAETETVRKIADALDQIDPERAKFIALPICSAELPARTCT